MRMVCDSAGPCAACVMAVVMSIAMFPWPVSSVHTMFTSARLRGFSLAAFGMLFSWFGISLAPLVVERVEWRGCACAGVSRCARVRDASAMLVICVRCVGGKVVPIRDFFPLLGLWACFVVCGFGAQCATLLVCVCRIV